MRITQVFCTFGMSDWGICYDVPNRSVTVSWHIFQLLGLVVIPRMGIFYNLSQCNMRFEWGPFERISRVGLCGHRWNRVSLTVQHVSCNKLLAPQL